MKLEFGGDKRLRYLFFVFIAVSLWLVASASSADSIRRFSSNGNIFIKHAIYCFMAVAAVYFLSRAPKGTYYGLYHMAPILTVFSIILLILTIAVGKEVNDAKRWLYILPGLSIQTADVFKFSIITLTAKVMADARGDREKLKKNILKLFIPLSIGFLLIVTQDLSSALLIVFMVIVLLFIGYAPLQDIFKIGGILVAAFIVLFAAYSLFKADSRAGTWQSRITSYVEGNNGYQATAAKAAIAQGGLINFKPGASKMKNLLPQASSDFVFAILVEEYGMLGGLFVIILYILFAGFSIRIMQRVKRSFAMYLVAGYSSLIVIQAFTHIWVNVGLFPVTGQPLPFISKGGTFLVLSGVMVGLILNISKGVEDKRRKPKMEKKPAYDATEDTLITNPLLMD